MFKKTLIALAVAGASSTAFAAADVDSNSGLYTISAEGAASATAISGPVIVVDLGAEYAVGDLLTLTFSGSALDDTTAPASINPVLVDGNDTMTLGLLNSSSTHLTYRVTELTYDGNLGNTSVAGTVTIAADVLDFDTADVLASGSIDVSYAATAGGAALDTPAGTDGTHQLVDVVTQFSASVTGALDATIDVSAQRLAFDDPGTTDVLVITPVNGNAGTTFDATVVGMTYTVTGDFAFLDDDATTTGVQLQAGSIGIVGGGAITSIDATTLVIDHAGLAAQTVTFDVECNTATTTGGSCAALAEQTFTADVEVQYTDHGTNTVDTGVVAAVAGTSDLVSGGAAGAWNLNGSVVEVPYIPFGPNTQPIIRHTNTGAQSGDITMRYMVEGVDTTWQSYATNLFTNATPGVRNMLSEVSGALAAEGYDASVAGFKVALEFTTNVPGGDVNIFVGAKVSAEGQDRLSIGNF